MISLIGTEVHLFKGDNINFELSNLKGTNFVYYLLIYFFLLFLINNSNFFIN